MAGLPNSAKGAHYPDMKVHRTTKAGRCLIAATLFVLTAGVQGAIASERFDESLSVRLVSSMAMAPHWPPDLVIEGVWPRSCLPGVVSTSLIDSHIDVLLRTTGTACSEVATPLSLRVNPVRASGQRQMALGIYEVRLFLVDSNGSARLIGFRLLRSGADDTSSRPESGFWWSVSTASLAPALAGSGLSIEQQGENLAVTLLSYESGARYGISAARACGQYRARPPVCMMGGGERLPAPAVRGRNLASR